MPPVFVDHGRSTLLSDVSGGTVLGDYSPIVDLVHEFLLFLCVGWIIRISTFLNAVESV